MGTQRAEITELLRSGDKHNLQVVIGFLGKEDSFVKCDIAEALGALRICAAVKPLIGLLKDENFHVRLKAAEALGKIGDARAIEPLVLTLKDPNEYVPGWAAKALGEIGNPAYERLIALLRDNRGDVRKHAVTALGLIGDAGAFEALAGLLKDDDWRAGQAAAEALGKLGAGVLEPLVLMLRDEDARVRRGAAVALGIHGDKKAIDPLRQSLTDWYSKYSAAEALQRLGWRPRSGKPSLLRRFAQRIEAAILVKSEPQQEDLDAVHFWVACNDKDGIGQNWLQVKNVLFHDLQSDSYQVIENATYSFIRIGNRRIIPSLIRILDRVGNKMLAEAYLNCGQHDLSRAANDWARRNGYEISAGSGAHPVNWGSSW